jgi:hypothetical protein
MAQAEARVRSRVSQCGICGGQCDTGTGFFPSTSVFPFQFHSTAAPLLGKIKKKLIFIFITELHNKPQGCGVSIVSAAGPFTKKRKDKRDGKAIPENEVKEINVRKFIYYKLRNFATNFQLVVL